MSIEFIDGFDHYSSNFSRKWDAATNGINIFAGRFGGSSFWPDAGGLRRLLSGNLSTVVIGFACNRNSPAAFGLLCLHDGGTLTTQGTNQVDLRCTATGALQVTRNGTVVGTSTSGGLLGTGSWVWIEFKVTIGSSAAYEVRVLGATVLSGVGNTQNTANAFVNQISFNIVAGDNGRGTGFDDLYILNTSGSTNNDFLGECRIATSFPTGDGATVQWTPSTGTTHWPNVDDANPNDDTDYNSSGTVGQIDLITYPSLVTSANVACVQSVICARKDDVGIRQIAEQCKSGATTFTGATQTVGASYSMFREIREVDPNTGAAWTLANANAAQFGVKVIA